MKFPEMINKKKYFMIILLIILSIVIFIRIHKIISQQIQIIEDQEKDISITAKSAYQKYREYANNLLIIDVRDERFYNISRIQGSLSFPFYKFEKNIGNFEKKFRKDIFIIFYCDSKLCSLSKMAVKKFKKYGYLNTYYLKGGIEEWQKKGYPVYTSH